MMGQPSIDDNHLSLATVVERQLAELASSIPSGASARLWEQALVEPLRDFLNRPGKAFRARMVESGWRWAGARSAPPAELPCLVELIHAGSLIVDDIQDGSTHRRGLPTLHRLHGVPIALNSGGSLYFLPFALLERIGLPPTIELEMTRRMTRAMLRCHQGQALDLAATVDELPRDELPGVVRAISELKTGCLTELAIALGAMAAGANDEQTRLLGELGLQIGVGLQMLNDLANLHDREPGKRGEDLRAGRPTWPWAWLALTLDDAEYESFRRRARRLPHDANALDTFTRDMRGMVLEVGRAQAREHFRAGLDRIEARLGSAPALDDVARQIARLERAYE